MRNAILTLGNKNTFNSIGREKGQVLRFQRIVMSLFWSPGLRLGFASQRGIVNFEITSLNDPHIRWNPISKFDLNDVTQSQFLGFQINWLAITDGKGVLRHQILEGVHNLGGFRFLVVGKDTGDHDDSSEDHTQVQIIIRRLLVVGSLANKMILKTFLPICR